jgi:integrase/recombinase XerD
LRIIQEISGHRNLEELQKYLEVRPEQIKGAVSSLSMLGHIGDGYVRKRDFVDVNPMPDAETVSRD